MNRRITPDEESPLLELFETLTPPLEDEGFSGNVVRRISRRLWVRRIALGTATLVGGVLAFGPFSELAVFLAQGVIVIATRWNDPAWLGAEPGAPDRGPVGCRLARGDTIVATIARPSLPCVPSKFQTLPCRPSDRATVWLDAKLWVAGQGAPPRSGQGRLDSPLRRHGGYGFRKAQVNILRRFTVCPQARPRTDKAGTPRRDWCDHKDGPPASARHTDYIGYWLKVLRDDGRIISRAATGNCSFIG